MTATTTVVTSMAVTGVSVYGAVIAGGSRPNVRPLVGIGVAGFALLIAASSPTYDDLAARLAVIIATTAALTAGYRTLTAAGRYLS